MSADEFICPACGATVPAKAHACPECGSDEQTGWSDETFYDGTGIEDSEEFNYEAWRRSELGHAPQRSSRQWLWWAVAVLMLALLAWFLLLR